MAVFLARRGCFVVCGHFDRVEEIGGAALDGLVLQHLCAWIEYGQHTASIYFWRTKSGREVDFIIYGEEAFVAIEVKDSAKVHAHDLRPLKAFAEEYPLARRMLLDRGSRRLLIDDIPCIPCDEFLLALRPNEPLPNLMPIEK